MLEFIGAVAVVWVLWNVLKAARAVIIKRRLEIAVLYADRYGVPATKAKAILDDVESVKETRRLLAAQSREFASKKAWEQLGETIVYLHKSDSHAENWLEGILSDVRASMTSNVASVAGTKPPPRS